MFGFIQRRIQDPDATEVKSGKTEASNEIGVLSHGESVFPLVTQDNIGTFLCEFIICILGFSVSTSRIQSSFDVAEQKESGIVKVIVLIVIETKGKTTDPVSS